MIDRIEETTSTNDEARDAKYRHGDAVWAERQTAGRGQRGHSWTSGEGLNLTFSLVWEPRFLDVREQFALLQAVALGLTDAFAELGVPCRIKWTNDIYVNDRKLAGILIEHSLAGGCLARSVVGIGINVNQTEFDPALPNPTSLARETGRTFDREEVLKRTIAALSARYGQLERGGKGVLRADYLRRLYRLGERQRFRIPATGEEFEGTIRGVEPSGELRVEHPDGRVQGYLFRRIEFIVSRGGPHR